MKSLSTKHKLLGSTTLSTAIALAALQLGAAPALAQETAEEDVIRVTGTLIAKSKNLVETSPVTSIGSEEFAIRGTLRVEDMINTLPQAFGAQGANLANGSTGTASVDLRGLGSSRTLVLLNGRRLPYGSTNIYAPDLNFIPAALIENVDILTGGASATYGADAIAGVVNFQLNDNFEGFRIDTNYSGYRHHNNNDEFQSLLSDYAASNPSQYRVPNGSTWEGETIDVTAVFGGDLADGRGHMTGYVGYQNTDPIIQDAYDYSQCALAATASGYRCSGSSTNQYSNILSVSSEYRIPGVAAGNVAGEEYKKADWARLIPSDDTFAERDFSSDTFNYNPYNHFQRPQERYFGGFFSEYDLSDNVEFYSEFMFMQNRTNSQIAPSGIFGAGVNGDAGGINCDNPFLSAQQQAYICGEIADGAINRLTADGSATYVDDLGVALAEGTLIDTDGNALEEDDKTFYPATDGQPDQVAFAADAIAGNPGLVILRRNVEGGLRNQDVTHTTFRGVLGLRGDIGNTPLSYDVYAMYNQVHRSGIYNNDLSISKLSAALYAVENDDGDIVCKINNDDDPTNDDANCVAYDAFSGAGPDPAAVAYITNPLNLDGKTVQQVVSATLSGPLDDYGVVFPMAETGVAFAVGVEYRRDYLESNPDANYISGDGAGQGGPTLPISGTIETFDVFGEVNIPIIQNRPNIEELGLDIAYRYSDYSLFETNAFKVGGSYSPIADLKLRASYQRAVRVPNIFELFSSQSIGLFDLSGGDPCGLQDDAASATRTATECANTGLPASDYPVANNPAGQYNTYGGGNPDLDPELSDTFTVGFVYEPAAVPGLAVSLDYFDIVVEDYIGTVPEALSLTKCLDTGDDYYCSLINRGTGGTLWANNTGYITATNLNTGSLSTTGFDILATYTHDLGEYGLKVDLVGTQLNELITVPLPNSSSDETYDCTGLYADNCDSPKPEWRHKLSATLEAPADWSITGTWRYTGAVTASQLDESQAALYSADVVKPVDAKLDAQHYLDLSARYTLGSHTYRVGVNNVFDEEPPITSLAGTAPGNGNTYPQVYDALGRYIFIGATFDF